MKYIFGPVPSRRLGNSLGVSPIPEGTCNFNCTYCQLGRTTHMTNRRKDFFPVSDIVDEFKTYITENNNFDVVSIVGEGEPTLYSNLGQLIIELKKLTDKPITVITNAALMTDKSVRDELLNADIVLPSLDGFDINSFKTIDRPIGTIDFNDVTNGIIEFSHEFKGHLWLEIMLIEGINTTDEAIEEFKNLLQKISYDRLYLNSPVRPPAEKNIVPVSKDVMEKVSRALGGISIDTLTSGSFYSDITDDLSAIISICARHPMNNFEITSFLVSRKLNEQQINDVFKKLNSDDRVSQIEYKGITTYRIVGR